MADVFMDALKRHVSKFDTQYEAAAALGIKPAYLSDLLNARRNPSERILAALHLKRVIARVGSRSAGAA